MDVRGVFFIIQLLLAIFILSEIKAENRIKIAIIDSGISLQQSQSKILCENGNVGLFDDGIDDHSHGTNIFGLIANNLNYKKYCIISYKVWSPTNQNSIKYMKKAIRLAILNNVKYLNISMGGTSYDSSEFFWLKRASKYMSIFVAAGNDGKNLKDCDYYPACYRNTIKNNFYVVGAYDIKQSNYGNIVDFYGKGLNMGTPAMTGTSQATAYYTNIFIRNSEK